ncbi:hypothetical protein PMNALOAF_4102 [Methylobacterium adhaesivum]|uniref:NrS-1 polymerase-like helicase domain-containing protein n=1 Tax=Methylobacterium adhaesivum TaxID=333297 RepID=A0ABT8BLB2_9HYPH|nr:primase-helicase family protein [Methylobacterium adhaesivum]MDN3592480.1 hypothetical protein [Methylobacterium adhaesivum]GJD32823.1 hypothetical protein PMNALOAF_4102 [Methylobacterium adhaesivum]
MNMTIPPSESNNTKGFLSELFQGAEAGFVTMWLKLSKTESETYTFPVTDLEGAAAKHDELRVRGDVYVCRGLQEKAPAAGERGKEAGIIFVGGLFADIDTREGPHSTPAAELPADANEALKLIAEAKLPPPTLLVHTGGGCHPHWLYAHPAMILTPEERSAEKMLSRAIQKRLRDTFKAHGYVLDGTADLTRVCKAPGSLNHKTAPYLKSVTLIHQGGRYDRAELAEMLAPDLAMASRGVPGAGKGTVAEMIRAEATKAHLVSGKAKPDEFAPVLAGCAFIQHCDVVQEKLIEPWWYRMVGVVARTVNGRRWVHEMSKRHPDYTFEETETKIDQALEAATGPTWCSTVADGDATSPPFEGCARCPFRAAIRTPLALANQGRAMAAIQQGVVFVVKGRSYLHLASGEKLDPEEFGDSVKSKIGSAPHDALMKSPTMPKVMHRDYRAGVAQLVLPEPDGTFSVNLWQRGGVEPAAGDYQPILDFFARFLPDTCSREHVIQYLAHLIQHPGEKIEHGIIVTGGYGTGKSTLHRIVVTMIGAKNARKIEGVELGQEWTARLVDAKVLMIEEAHHGERLEVFEKTKTLLTEEFYYAHDKNVRRFRGRTPRGMFLASNDAAPMVLPRGDRRWFVCATPETPDTEEEKMVNRTFFKRLHDRLDQDDSLVAAFAEHLRTVSLEGFNAKGAPPMTKAKEVATEESRTPTAQVLAELIQAGAYPLHRDIVEVKEVVGALKASTWVTNLGRLNPRSVAKAMRDVGARQVNMDGDDHMELVIGGGKKVRPWAIRSVPHWRTASREDLKGEFLRPVGDAGPNVTTAFMDAQLKRKLEDEATARRDALFQRMIEEAASESCP